GAAADLQDAGAAQRGARAQQGGVVLGQPLGPPDEPAVLQEPAVLGLVLVGGAVPPQAAGAGALDGVGRAAGDAGDRRVAVRFGPLGALLRCGVVGHGAIFTASAGLFGTGAPSGESTPGDGVVPRRKRSLPWCAERSASAPPVPDRRPPFPPR